MPLEGARHQCPSPLTRFETLSDRTSIVLVFRPDTMKRKLHKFDPDLVEKDGIRPVCLL